MNGTTKTAPLFLRLITPLFFVKQGSFRPSKRRNVFILSTGRTATTFLGEFFDKHEDYEGLHEPKPSRILRMWSIARFDGAVSDRYLRAALFKKRRHLYNPHDTRVYVESNPYLSGFVDVISDVFESPTIIHIVRDPRDYVKSAMNHGNDRGLKLFFNSHIPYWYADVKKILGLREEIPMRYRAAAYWTIANRVLMEYGKHHPENYHLFRYEDIFKGDQKDMQKLLAVLNLDASELEEKRVSKKGRNKSRFSSVKSWGEWPQEDCQIVHDLCDPLMAEFGYGLEPEWKQKLND